MGKGIIVSGGGRAYYKVQILKDPGIATERLKTIDQLLINSDVMLDRLAAEYATLSGLLSSAETDYAFATAQYRAGMITFDELMSAKSTRTKAEADIRTNLHQQAYIKLQKISLNKEKIRLEAAIVPEERYLWCVDYTLNMPADKIVGILECDGDFMWMNIEEGCNNEEATGMMQPAAVSTPAGVFRNLALMPCWQRHKPYYRAGRLSEIDYDKNTATVTLNNPDYSTATKFCGKPNTIPVNFFTNIPETPASGVSVFKNVTIQYMGCNAEAFVNGDHVIVRFLENNWSKPLIIGFHDNPRPSLNLIQIRFDNVATNEELLDEIELMILEASILKGFYEQYKTVFCPMYVAVLDSLVGQVKFFTTAIQY